MRWLMTGSRSVGLIMVLLVATAALLVACGGGGDKDGGAVSEAAPTAPEATEQEESTPSATEAEEQPGKPAAVEQEAAEPEPEPQADPEPTAPAGAVTALVDVEQAVVLIQAEGSFRDPDFGEVLNAAGSGTGFIIDSSGLAVTNNHVVTGAAFLQVYFSGDDRPRNARILGVSECSDLAVIDIEGDDHPFLLWYEGPIQPGLETFAVGYPLGDPEYTLTGGVISKADADGESEWASVDFVLEHDALLIGGNSGGPLVTKDGAVVGINYAGNDLGQSFAIRRDEAQRILDRLTAGENVTSIGVNGQAILTFDGLSGIWVASVRSGSPADIAGIQPGDIITRIEGLLLATDGTMSDYCDILRTHGADSVLSVEVLRYDTGQVLEGRLNSGDELEESFSFAEELQEEFAPEPTPGLGYSGYSSVSDDSGLLVMEVPFEWFDVDGSAWIWDGQAVGPSITAAADIFDFYNVWTEPGVFFGASWELAAILDEEALLDRVQEQFNFSGCDYSGRFLYEDPAYTGLYDQFENCGGEDVLYISLAAMPADRSFIINVQVQLVTAEDVDALDRILDTFFVIGG